jgi:small-conductance mechanosensitive channel
MRGGPPASSAASSWFRRWVAPLVCVVLAVLGALSLRPLPLAWAEESAEPAEPSATASPSAKAQRPAPTSRPASAVPSELRPRSTPRRAYLAFIHAATERDFALAAESLDLRHIPAGRRAREGAELAAMLSKILAWRVVIEPDSLSDEPEPEGLGAEGLLLDRVELDGAAHSFWLARVRTAQGYEWMFPRASVESIRVVYEANERRWLEERVPELLRHGTLLGLGAWQWIGLFLLALLTYGVGRSVGAIGIALAAKPAEGVGPRLGELVRSLGRPVRLGIAIAAFVGLTPWLLLPALHARIVERGARIGYIVAFAWMLTEVLRVGTETWERHLPDDTAGQIASRGIRTRLTMIRRIGTALVSIVAAGFVLLQFDVVRNVGLSLLASAGIAGVLVGFAAQRTLGGIIAGVQLSVTQPIRIGDVVVFRGDVGTVERIYFTYVVVRLWDERCLIVPAEKVMSDVFENWTRVGASMLAPVELWVDHTAPVERLRAKFTELCEASELWDKRQCTVLVVENTDRAMRLRGLASVSMVTRAFDLRCELREGWVRYLQELDGGAHLPKGRIDLSGPKTSSSSPATLGVDG